MIAFMMSGAWGIVRSSKSVGNAVRTATRIFEKSGVQEAAASAEYLAISSFEAIQTRRAAITAPAKPQLAEIEKYISLCRQREERGVPIQYLVGDWDFHNITLLVRPPVLIPRPETEELVEHLLADVKSKTARIIDVGCGSGAIMLAALVARPQWTAVGVDVAQEAVDLSLDNTKLLNLGDRAKISIGKLESIEPRPKFDALVSNPPYIPLKDMGRLDAQVRDHEDFRALCGGEDGLDVVREIFENAPRMVKSGGSVWLELDSIHPENLQGMRIGGLQFVERFDDMYGRPRFCHWRVL